jgi:shikimate 5-dehydrogenase
MWNEIFREREIDAFFDFYRTSTDRDLELRLSEMFLHERRAYLLDPLFSLSVRPLLDRMDPSAKATQRIDTVINDDGILIGFDMGATLDDQKVEKRLSLFLS